MIKRKRLEHFGVNSRGPFIVEADLGNSVSLQDLNTGRILVEAKPNVKLLSLGATFEE